MGVSIPETASCNECSAPERLCWREERKAEVPALSMKLPCVPTELGMVWFAVLHLEMSLGSRADSFSCVGLIIFGITFEPFSYRIIKDNSGFCLVLYGLSIVNKALVNDSQKNILSFNLLGE